MRGARVRSLSEYGDVRPIPADLRRHDECRRLAEQSLPRGALHILVNNAGATWGEPLETSPRLGVGQSARPQPQVAVLACPGAAAALRRAGTADDPARIINVGSIDGIRVPPLPVYSYASSKAAVHQLTRMLARELGPADITVNAVAPGPFDRR